MSGEQAVTIVLQLQAEDGAKSQVAQDLAKGRAFVLGQFQLPLRTHCRLVVSRPGSEDTLGFDAEVVWVSQEPPVGVGIQLLGAPAMIDKQVESYLSATARPRRRRTVHDRVRGLGAAEREVMARQGTLAERVALERCYGGAVWEALLQNPQLTTVEVMKIAKNGAIPRPLVNLIVANGGWLAKAEVQRALLSNPRVSGPHLDRVLRALPRQELELVRRQTAYRSQVRAQASRLLKK